MRNAPFVTNYLSEHLADDAYATLAGYQRAGGYAAARKAVEELSPDDVVEQIERSGLKGRGGAGFPGGPKMVLHAA